MNTERRMIGLKAMSLALAFASVFFGIRQVDAVPTTFGFTGTVTQFNVDPNDPFNGTIGFGTSISGTYTFESTTPNSISDPNAGSYLMSGTLAAMQANIGGNLFSAVDSLAIGVANNFAGLVDQYTVLAQTNSIDLAISLFFQDDTATVFSNNTLLLIPPTLANFSMRNFSLIALVEGSQVQIDGHIDTLSPFESNISITPPSVNFGNVAVGQSAQQTVTITNQTSSTAALTGSVGTLLPPFSVLSGGGAFNLAPGQSVTVTVQFSPTAPEAASANLSIIHNATNQPSISSISLSGTGVGLGAGVVVSFILAPTQGKPGSRIAVQNTVTNQGPQTASSVTVNFYLSTDTQVNAGDFLIGKRTVKNLAPGASSGPVSTNVTIPKNTVMGSYFIGTIVGTNTNYDLNGIAICPSLSKPKILSPKNRGTNISTTPTLTWSNVNGTSTYEIQVATDSAFTNIVASTTGLTDTQWPVTPALSNSTTYFWRVRAVNPCGPGPFSGISRFRTS